MRKAHPHFNGVERIIVALIMVLIFLFLAKCSVIFERSRIARAKMRINAMRKLGLAYYLKNNSLDNLQNCDVWEDNLCTDATFYRYWLKPGPGPEQVNFFASRCTKGGMLPNASRQYNLYLSYNYGTGQESWHCYYQDDSSACFGLSI